MRGTANIDDPVIAICINRQYPFCRSASDLYNVTRGLWHVNRERGDKAHYAFAVYQGEIKEVYEIGHWIPVSKESNDYWVERHKAQGRIINPAVLEGRSQFIGKVAPKLIREKYVDKTMPVRHTRNPILYFRAQVIVDKKRIRGVKVVHCRAMFSQTDSRKAAV